MDGRNPGAKKIFFAVSGVVFGVLMIFLIYKIDPADSKVFPPCPFHKLTGLYCPGCGSLRAVHQISHGNIIQAFRLNPLMVIMAPFVGYALIRQLIYTLIRKPLRPVFIKPVWVWILLGIIIAYWIGRNIPFWPFSLLGPH
jgi:hypothetical protein